MTPKKAEELVRTTHYDDWRTFAKIMFRLEDADPGYMLLHRAELPRAQKLRYVLGWCSFYNPGIAAVASQYQGAEFYDYLRAVYPTAKRASERRHFRGKAGLNAIAQWQARFPKPEAMVDACFADTYLGVRKNMQGMAQMGDYFYWKLADIQDTVFAEPVDFSGCVKYMPKLPKVGSGYVLHVDTLGTDGPLSSKAIPDLPQMTKVLDDITAHIRDIPYPIKAGRTLALQEAETVCCVFKQMHSGTYRYGFRTAKAVRRLEAVQAEAPRTVKKLLDGMWAGGIWNPELVKTVGAHL